MKWNRILYFSGYKYISPLFWRLISTTLKFLHLLRRILILYTLSIYSSTLDESSYNLCFSLTDQFLVCVLVIPHLIGSCTWHYHIFMLRWYNKNHHQRRGVYGKTNQRKVFRVFKDKLERISWAGLLRAGEMRKEAQLLPIPARKAWVWTQATSLFKICSR